MRLLKTFAAVWKNRAELNQKTFDEDERAFLPGALALQSTPPSPLPRLLVAIILGLFCFAIVWASLGEVNVVASAEGKIIPSGRVKVIQPLEKAVVRDILVREGDRVQQGDTLIVLDQTHTQANSERLASDLFDSRHKMLARKAFLSWMNQSLTESTSKAADLNTFWQSFSPEPDNSFIYFQWLTQRTAQFSAERTRLQQNLKRSQAEKGVSLQVIRKLERTLPLVKEHADALRSSLHKEAVARVEFLQVERDKIQQEEDLAAEQARLQVYKSQIQEAENQLHLHIAQVRTQMLDELSGLEREVEALQQEWRKAEDLNQHQKLVAPVDGVVQQLMVTTLGGIVTPAQELMLIVPEKDQREVEVMLENKDIGFVYEGQTAEIKVHTFPFTKYGVINAEVIHISDDAIADENRGLVFPMKLKMLENTIAVGQRLISLKPGMSVTAEVQTGKRRLIEFFLSPLLRYQSESVRER